MSKGHKTCILRKENGTSKISWELAKAFYTCKVWHISYEGKGWHSLRLSLVEAYLYIPPLQPHSPLIKDNECVHREELMKNL